MVSLFSSRLFWLGEDFGAGGEAVADAGDLNGGDVVEAVLVFIGIGTGSGIGIGRGMKNGIGRTMVGGGILIKPEDCVAVLPLVWIGGFAEDEGADDGTVGGETKTSDLDSLGAGVRGGGTAAAEFEEVAVVVEIAVLFWGSLLTVGTFFISLLVGGPPSFLRLAAVGAIRFLACLLAS